MRTLNTIEMILSRGSKDTNYKFALLTSIIDYIIENPTENSKNNFHLIPITYLAKQFSFYYIPLIIEKVQQGKTMKNRNSIALITYFNNLKEKLLDKNPSKSISDLSLILQSSSSMSKLNTIIQEEVIVKELKSFLLKVQKLILDQPLQHRDKIDGNRRLFFSLIISNKIFLDDYDTNRIEGLMFGSREFNRCNNIDSMYDTENCYILLDHGVYEELSRVRFILRDMIIKRWAFESMRKYNSNHPSLLNIFDF